MENSTFDLFGFFYQAKENLIITCRSTIVENKYIKIYEMVTEIPFIDLKIVRYVFSNSKNDTVKALTKKNLLKAYASCFFISELNFFLRSFNSPGITRKRIFGISNIINEKSYDSAYEILKYKFLLADRFNLKKTWCM